MKHKLIAGWKLLPSYLRKLIVLVIGFTLIAFGGALVVLPGPFTLPFVILGLVVLALEFAWAETLLIHVRKHGAKIHPKKLFKR